MSSATDTPEPTDSARWPSRRALAVAVGVAAIYSATLLALGLKYHRIGNFGVETDFYWFFVKQAEAAQGGEIIIDLYRGPLYPWLLGLAELITGRYLSAGMLIGSLSAGLVVVLTYVLGRQLLKPAFAVGAACLVAFHPIVVEHTYTAGTDLLFVVLTLGAVVAYVAARPDRLRYAALGGTLVGLAVLTRYNALPLAAVAPIAAAIRFGRGRAALRLVAVGAACSAMLIVPWGVYTAIEEGGFLHNRNWQNIAFEVYGLDNVSWDEFWFSEESIVGENSASVLLDDPILVLRTVAGNVPEQLAGDAVVLGPWNTGAALVGLVGLLLGARRRRAEGWKAAAVVSASWIALLGPLLLVFYTPRFSLGLMPGYCLLAAGGTALIGRIPRVGERVGLALCAGLVVVTAVMAGQHNRDRIRSGPTYILDVADGFAANFDSDFGGDRVAARKPQIAHYTGRELFVFPQSLSPEELVDTLQEEGVQLLYFSPAEARVHPQLAQLTDPANAPPGLRLLLGTTTPPSALYLVSEPPGGWPEVDE